MKNSIALLKDNRIYFLGFLLFLCTGLISLLLSGETATSISVDALHPFWLNVFFINYTFIGDGVFAVSLIALYLFYFKKRQQGLALLYAFIVSGIVVQIIKNMAHLSHPKIFFEQGQYLFFTGDISLPGYSSFPSGHTATVFTIATVLVLLMKNKKWQLPILAAAVLTGYSRMYLAQHSLLDILAGAMIGCIGGLVAVHLVYHARSFKFSFHGIQGHKTETITASLN